MAFTPLIAATVKVTSKDINGNNLAKQYNQVQQLIFDFNKGTVNIADGAQLGQYHPISPMTALTCTITLGAGGQWQFVMS